jgi:hypothetical protein
MWMHPYNVTPACITLLLEDSKNFGLSPEGPRGKPQHYSGLVEAMDPSKIAPKSMSNMCKVYFIIFDVDVHVDVSSLQHYCCSLWSYFWKMIIARLLADSWGANHSIVWWLRLWTPSQITPTSMSNTYEVSSCHHLHMLWRCIWMCPHYITPALVDNAFVSYNSGYHLRGKLQNNAVVEAMDPF